LIKQLPKGYKICLLKNEFGDLKGPILVESLLITVDSELAKESNIDGVQEMLNGCLCCTLVGRMADALLELKGLPHLEVGIDSRKV
jgi:G3E family GTPase